MKALFQDVIARYPRKNLYEDACSAKYGHFRGLIQRNHDKIRVNSRRSNQERGLEEST